MERREWYQGNPENFINSHRVYQGDGRLVATTATPDDAVQLVRSLNQHTALVEQRDLLVSIAKDALRFREEMNGKCDHDEAMTKLCTQCEIRAALATVEQGGGEL